MRVDYNKTTEGTFVSHPEFLEKIVSALFEAASSASGLSQRQLKLNIEPGSWETIEPPTFGSPPNLFFYDGVINVAETGGEPLSTHGWLGIITVNVVDATGTDPVHMRFNTIALLAPIQ